MAAVCSPETRRRSSRILHSALSRIIGRCDGDACGSVRLDTAGTEGNRSSSYWTADPYLAIAHYHDLRAEQEAEMYLNVVERLLSVPIESGWRVLDLAGGSGRRAALFAAKGCETCLVDPSPALVALARAHFPRVASTFSDVRSYPTSRRHELIVWLDVGINRLESTEDLAEVFARVHDSMAPGGFFVFDGLTTQGAEDMWSRSCEHTYGHRAIRIEGRFNPVALTGSETWTVSEGLASGLPRTAIAELRGRCFLRSEILGALAAANLVLTRMVLDPPELASTAASRNVFVVRRSTARLAAILTSSSIPFE